jgi:hypothetical protein
MDCIATPLSVALQRNRIGRPGDFWGPFAAKSATDGRCLGDFWLHPCPILARFLKKTARFLILFDTNSPDSPASPPAPFFSFISYTPVKRNACNEMKK